MRLATIATFSVPRLYRPAELRTSLQGVLSHRSERARTALMMVALFVSYVASARLGIELSVAHGVITPVWAPTGIALAALVLYGPGSGRRRARSLGRQRDERRLGLPRHSSSRSATRSRRSWAACSCCGVRLPAALDRVRDVLSLVLFAAVVSTPIAATNGVTDALDLRRRRAARTTAPMAPLVDRRRHGRPARRAADLRSLDEPVAAARQPRAARGARRSSSRSSASARSSSSAGSWRYPHLLFPLLIWATLRFRQLGAVTSSFIVGGDRDRGRGARDNPARAARARPRSCRSSKA